LLEADMRIAIQAMISDVEGQDTRTQDIGVLEYDAEAAPASGLGLFIGEAHQLLRQLQTVVLREQAARFVERVSRCRQCGSRLGVKDAKTIVYRTVYGKARLDSPRLYSTCGRCGACATPARSFSPLADALPERTHPQWLWLQSRYAAVMSYRQAQTFLRDAFPAGRSLPVSSMKVNVRHTGQRLEAEVQLVARTFVRLPRRSRRPASEQQPPQGPQIELTVDAGYIRALPEKEGIQRPDGSLLFRGAAQTIYVDARRRLCSTLQAFWPGPAVLFSAVEWPTALVFRPLLSLAGQSSTLAGVFLAVDAAAAQDLAVDAELAELVDDHRNAPASGVGEDVAQERALAAAKKAGDDGRRNRRSGRHGVLGFDY
jgi:hypothetical protein